MSTTEVKTNPFADALVEVGDGSVVTDPAALAAVIEELRTTEKRGLSSFRAMTTVLKQCARLRVQGRSLIQTPAGNPDWSASTDAYRVTVLAAEATLWGDSTPDEKRRVDGAIRQHVTRTYLEPAMTEHVLASLSEADKGDVKYADNSEGLTILTGEIPPKVKSAIAAQYKAANLNIPPKFGGTRGGGSDTPTVPNPAADFAVALGALENLAADRAATDLLRAVSALSERISAKDARYGEGGPDNVAKILHRIAVVAEVAGKAAIGKASDAEIKSADSAKWSKTDS